MRMVELCAFRPRFTPVFTFFFLAITPLAPFTPLLNLHPLVFGLTPFGLPRSFTLRIVCASHGAEQTCKATCSAQTAPLTVPSTCPRRLVKITWFICIYWRICVLFFLHTNATMAHLMGPGGGGGNRPECE